MTYPGGKNGSGVAQAIINQIPPHRVYIEAFLGSGAIMRMKRPAQISVGVDVDETVVSQWKSCPNINDGAAAWVIPDGGTVIHSDALSFLETYPWNGDEFVYADPPYLFDARSSKRRIYTHEFGNVAEHIRLLNILKAIPARVAISGYEHPLYAELLNDWRTITFNTIDRAGNVKVEWLWMNYQQPEELHDYRYLGKNFRERERLTRIRKRWVARLQKMPIQERLMLSAAIAEVSDATRLTSRPAGNGGALEPDGNIVKNCDECRCTRVSTPFSAMVANTNKNGEEGLPDVLFSTYTNSDGRARRTFPESTLLNSCRCVLINDDVKSGRMISS